MNLVEKDLFYAPNLLSLTSINYLNLILLIL